MRKFTFIWFIQNYSYYWRKETKKFDSPTFLVEMMQQTSWYLTLHLRGSRDPDFISLSLHRRYDSNGPNIVALNYELYILDAKGRAMGSKELPPLYTEFVKGGISAISDFYEQLGNTVERASTLDTLRVSCTMWLGEGKVDEEALSYIYIYIYIYAKTQIGLEKISYVNTIENFATLEPYQKITSDVISVSKDALKFSTNVYIKSETGSEDKVMVEIFLDSKNAYLITCQIYMLNSTGKEVECGKIDTRNDKSRTSTLRAPINFGKRKLLDEKHKYLPNDKLTLRFECMLSTGIEFQKIEDTFYNLHLTPLLKEQIENTIFSLSTTEPKSIADDLKSLYQDQILSDIEIKTASKVFPAHKSVLCARSPVFKSMLRTNMKEKFTDCIQVDDLEDSTIDQFLLFFYTDKVEDLQWESIKKLYFAADKYQVQRLKDICTSILITGLNRCNMCDLLILADKHQDSDLKIAVEKFICRKNNMVFCNTEWESFMEKNPILAMKTMYFYLKNCNN